MDDKVIDVAAQKLAECMDYPWTYMPEQGRDIMRKLACSIVAVAVAAERERWQTFCDQLRSDIDRPEGRWGIHGQTAVDDDYFTALEYVVAQMEKVLAPNVLGDRQAKAAGL